MKRTLKILAGSLAFLIYSPLFASASDAVSLTIEQLRAKPVGIYKERVYFSVILINNLEIPIEIYARWAGEMHNVEYAIEVRDQYGQTAHLTKLGEEIYRGNEPFYPGKYHHVIILPQKEYQESMSIDDIYQMEVPGDYTVRVGRKFDLESGSRYIWSNTVVVKIPAR